MMPNFTPIEVASLQKRYESHKTGSVLFITIVLLTVLVLSLIGYLLYSQYSA